MNKYIYDIPTTHEWCPHCEDEVVISTDGKSPCPTCGEKNMLPCSQCLFVDHNGNSMCDWRKDKGCTPFPLS